MLAVRDWCRDLPAVMVVDLTTGRVMHRYVLSQFRGEGIMTDVSAIDRDGDGALDLAYVGTTSGRMLTLDLHGRGRTDGAAWRLTERTGADGLLGRRAQLGAPVIDMRERDAAQFNLIATAADVGGQGRPVRRGPCASCESSSRAHGVRRCARVRPVAQGAATHDWERRSTRSHHRSSRKGSLSTPRFKGVEAALARSSGCAASTSIPAPRPATRSSAINARPPAPPSLRRQPS